MQTIFVESRVRDDDKRTEHEYIVKSVDKKFIRQT